MGREKELEEEITEGGKAAGEREKKAMDMQDGKEGVDDGSVVQERTTRGKEVSVVSMKRGEKKE